MKDIWELIEKQKPRPGGFIKTGMFTHLTNQIKTHLEANYITKEEAANQPKIQRSTFLKTSVIRKWDIVTTDICFIKHPALVFKITKEWVYIVCATSNGEKNHSIFEFKSSRFWAGKFLTNSVERITHEEAIKRFIGPFDNKKEAGEAIKTLNNYYKNVFI